MHVAYSDNFHDAHLDYSNYEETEKMHLSAMQLNKLNCIHNKSICNMNMQVGVPCFPETIPPIQKRRPFTEYENQRALMLPYVYTSNPVLGASSYSLFKMMEQVLQSGLEIWTAPVSGGNLEYVQNFMLEHFEVDQGQVEKIRHFDIDLNSVWLVDYGPWPLIFEKKQGDVMGNVMEFASQKYYSGRPSDDRSPNLMAQKMTNVGLEQNTIVYQTDLSAEGGKYQALSDGTCITTTRWGATNLESTDDYNSLLEAQEKYDPVNMRKYMMQHMSCSSIIFLYEILLDGTGHVDMYFKAGSDTDMIVGDVKYGSGDIFNRNQERMNSNAQLLEKLGYTVHRVIMPPVSGVTNNVPFTYVNSVLIVNGKIKKNLVPVSYLVDSNYTDEALIQWQKALPEFEHIPIDATSLSLGSGALHCVSRNIPNYPLSQSFQPGTCGDSNTCNNPSIFAYQNECQTCGGETEYECYGPRLGELNCGVIAKGDLNSDGNINVIDIVQMVNIILSSEDPNLCEYLKGDMNSDDLINVSDIVILVNIILNSTNL